MLIAVWRGIRWTGRRATWWRHHGAKTVALALIVLMMIYGLTQGRPLGRGIRESELLAPTPYNTYVIAGLPPTPICNPGRASLAAVLDAPQTNELYFVADGTGGHIFSSTLEQHLKNVEHWRQVEHTQKPTSATPSLGAG